MMKLLSRFAFNFNLRHYITALDPVQMVPVDTREAVPTSR
jgi:hypothetical protein